MIAAQTTLRSSSSNGAGRPGERLGAGGWCTPGTARRRHQSSIRADSATQHLRDHRPSTAPVLPTAAVNVSDTASPAQNRIICARSQPRLNRRPSAPSRRSVRLCPVYGLCARHGARGPACWLQRASVDRRAACCGPTNSGWLLGGLAAVRDRFAVSGITDGAAGADRLRLRDLIKGGARCGDRKNSSGSACRHAASCRQSRSGMVIVWSPGGLGGVVICGRDR